MLGTELSVVNFGWLIDDERTWTAAVQFALHGTDRAYRDFPIVGLDSPEDHG
jgi:hypothetical protein